MFAELLAKIGVDISDLNKAEVGLKNLEKTFTGVFKRAPSGELRAEAALGGAIRQIMQGDVGGAVESITHRLGIMGVIGGTAIGGLVIAFTKAHEAAKKYEQALKDAEKASHIAPSASEGLQALQADLLKTADLQGKIAHDMNSRWIAMGNNVGRLGSILSDTFVKGQAFQDPVGRRNAEDRTRNAEVLQRLTLHTGDDMRRQQDAAANMAEMAQLQATGDQAGIEAVKRREEHSKATYEAMKGYREVLDTVQDKETRKALKPELAAARGAKEVSAQAVDEAEQAMERRRVAMAQEELITSAQISGVKEQGLAADVEKLALAQVNIQHLQAQLEIQDEMVEAVKDETRAKIAGAQADVAADQKRRGEKKFEDTFQQSLYTVDELAKMKRTGWIGGDLNVAQFNAKEIQRLENRAQIEKAQGHPMEAFAALTQAQQIRAGMPLLKGSEKSPEFAFANAIDSASVFKGMLENLKFIADKVKTPTNPFLNK